MGASEVPAILRSPRAWGWTGVTRLSRSCPRAFPTGVGMDRCTRRWTTSSSRVPHGRGDGPRVGLAAHLGLVRSPRAWGWTGNSRLPPRPLGAFPTGVGMDRPWPGTWTASSSVPHGRGDGPSSSSSYSCPLGRSPRAWGWTEPRHGTGLPVSAFPTGVGMDRTTIRSMRTGASVPHGRGDGPVREHGDVVFTQRSPRAWGWTDYPAGRGPAGFAFPTGVGMDRGRIRLVWGSSCVPHGRGDGPLFLVVRLPVVARSPRAWGWTVAHGVGHRPPGAFPTGVGMDRSGCRPRPARARVPHGRGDGPAKGRHSIFIFSRSPRAWGWTVEPAVAVAEGAAFPTGVGMDRTSAGCPTPGRSVPHGRGDGPRVVDQAGIPWPRSPRAWGWTDEG